MKYLFIVLVMLLSSLTLMATEEDYTWGFGNSAAIYVGNKIVSSGYSELFRFKYPSLDDVAGMTTERAFQIARSKALHQCKVEGVKKCVLVDKNISSICSGMSCRSTVIVVFESWDQN